MSVALAIIGFQNFKLAILLLIVGGVVWLLSHESASAVWSNGTHSRKFVVTMTLLALVCGLAAGTLVGRFVLAPTIGVDMIMAWGEMSPNIAWVTVDVSSIIHDKGNFKVMLVCRAATAAVDAMRDTNLAKSGEYELSENLMAMQASLSPPFLDRLATTNGWMDYYLIEVPEKVMPEQIVTLLSLDALGGKILSGKGKQIGLQRTSAQPTVKEQ